MLTYGFDFYSASDYCSVATVAQKRTVLRHEYETDGLRRTDGRTDASAFRPTPGLPACHISTEFGNKSSNRFPFRARTDRQIHTHRLTLKLTNEHPTPLLLPPASVTSNATHSDMPLLTAFGCGHSLPRCPRSNVFETATRACRRIANGRE